MSSNEPRMIQLTVDPRRTASRVALAGATCAVVLVLLDLFVVYAHDGRVGPFREIFWLTAEETVGTWFSATLTLAVGMVLFAIGLVARRVETQGPAWVWHLLGGIFVYLSMDDAAQVHESLGTVLEHASGLPAPIAGLVDSFPTYHWQLLFGLPLLVLVYLLLGFAAPRVTTRPFRVMLITAVVILAAAVVLDFLEGLPSSHPMNLAERIVAAVDLSGPSHALFAVGPLDAVGHLLRVLEEFLEMLAMSLGLAALSGHLLDVGTPIRISRA